MGKNGTMMCQELEYITDFYTSWKMAALLLMETGIKLHSLEDCIEDTGYECWGTQKTKSADERDKLCKWLEEHDII